MIIRKEQPQDHAAIARITADAFAGVDHSDGTEPAIISALRDAGALALSLVAVDDDGRIAGHAAFSPVTIDGREGGWFGLGPVAVRPDRQRAGIGGALIRAGLEELRRQGAGGCVVLGEPAYYRRFGFERDEALYYDGAPAAYFMRIAFADPAPEGRVEYHPGFGAS
ncbi:GNAT family N-acetyltransferase [Sphingomonas fennica]|uniref:GNAT family N-acetyltransferase n=1 Tax=Edaphosphingomonas fennica TaxID=114404 RepID=A0A2T4HYF0_9SPHN|nr:N-acetyltransferase [Sphingomonas fennica]PTD21134.1 GNAT family N-acetyltransferase [Sphingomonas fennica]